MKKIYLLVLFVFGFSAFAQQKGISYQAVIINPKAVAAPGYNGSSIPLANKSICLSFQILNNANQVEYQESQSITTDAYGMVNVVIGTGTSGSGLVANLDAVNWNQGSKKLVVGVNTDGVCSNYTEISNQVLNYTPYSFYAQDADLKDGYVTDVKVAMGINPTKVGLGNVNNTSDANKPISIATQTALDLKANATDVTTSLALKEDASNKSNATLGTSTTLYPTQNAVKTYVDVAIAGATIVDADTATKGKIKLAGDLAGTADLPTVPGLALKANAADVTTSLGLKEDLSNKSSDIATDASPTINYPTVKAVKDYVDANSNTGTIVDADTTTKGKIKLAGDLAGTADLPTVPGLALKANATDVTTSLALKEDASNKSNSTLGTSTTLYPTQNAVKTYVDTAITGATIVDADTATKGKIKLAGDLAGTADLPTVPGLALKANTTDVTTSLALKEDASNKSNATLGTSTTLYPTQNAVKTYVDTAITGATIVDADTATKGKIKLAGDLAGTADLPTVPGLALKADIASPTFTGTVTAPIYASTPQTLTAGATISWNPANGLNASVTLDQNSTLSFTATPTAGAYGTLVVTQDATGGRTLTLPSTATNKVLGSSSTTTIALSSAANAKDILNFYYDGTNCYWNIGQGYGTAATAATTNLTNSVSGTLPVANGGTGASTLTGIVKGNGTGAMTVATAGTDYQAPITLTTTGTGAATLTGNTLNIPAVSSTVNANTITGTLPIANGGTGATTKTTAFDALSPMTSAGDLIYGGASGTGTRLGKGNNGTVLTMENNLPTWLTSIRATAGSTYNAAVGFSFVGGDLARNTGMFSDNPDGGGAATLKFRIATSNSTADPYLEISPSKVSVFPTTAATSKTTGALTVAGGLGVTGDVFATNLNASGTLSVSSFTVGQGKTPASGDNLAIGRSALNNTTSNGWPNIGLGSFSLNQTTDGKNNVGVGLNALYANTTGSNNIGIGTEAARNASTSSNITAIGMEALRYESGAGNTAVGSYAGKPTNSTVYSGTTNSTFIGYNTSTGKTAEQTITNATAIGYGATVTASDKIQLGNTSVTNVATSGTLTAGDVTYPKTHGTANQVLITSGSGSLSWASITAGTAITITNTAGAITISAAVRPTTDQFTATAAQTSFPLAQTPLNTKVWMFINGVRTNNLAYTISGTTVTYTPANNNSYTIVVGDRIQFDYAY